MSEVETVKIKSQVSEENQLGYIIINLSDFDEKKHELFNGDSDQTAVPVTRVALDAALADLPGDQVDPDYVVNSMRSYFGDLFTDADEARARDLVKAPIKKPSDGLTVDLLKAALAEKKINIPDGVTKKAELAALLDAAG